MAMESLNIFFTGYGRSLRPIGRKLEVPPWFHKVYLPGGALLLARLFQIGGSGVQLKIAEYYHTYNPRIITEKLGTFIWGCGV